ncbi:hypothetical protein FE257_012168 [Aspergillus nanangensis]|uniref:NmrA-like domain-containing protein n=1 Tax=Aspergillus nanangensis TaxID=2582783 RepID=A0AAD4CGE9_ASPNN|nr:hypothetical protein FE257_012168 [Aspergillus nanangensis]
MSSIFICGATGTQGGAIAHHLLKQNINIKTITRSINSSSAQDLKSHGVTVTEGDFDNEETLRTALTGCTSVFLNLMPNFLNTEAEHEQAQRIISIAQASGVKHIVYSSALAINDPQRLPHYDPASFFAKALRSKLAVENQVRTAGFETWTILRPGNFMSNFLLPMAKMYAGLTESGTWTTALTAETVLPMVDPNDIGQFGAAVLVDPARFHQQEVEIASQMMTVDEVLKVLSKVTGKELKASYMSREEIDAQAPANPLISAQLAMRDMAMFVDIEEVRKWGLKLGTFEQFLEREADRVAQTYSEV